MLQCDLHRQLTIRATCRAIIEKNASSFGSCDTVAKDVAMCTASAARKRFSKGTARWLLCPKTQTMFKAGTARARGPFLTSFSSKVTALSDPTKYVFACGEGLEITASNTRSTAIRIVNGQRPSASSKSSHVSSPNTLLAFSAPLGLCAEGAVLNSKAADLGQRRKHATKFSIATNRLQRHSSGCCVEVWPRQQARIASTTWTRYFTSSGFPVKTGAHKERTSMTLQ